MSQEQEPRSGNGELSVDDDQLPEDLRPTDDNPLAQPATGDGSDEPVAGVGEPDPDPEDGSGSGDGDDASAPPHEATSEDPGSDS
jgi:hypothetical protein